MPLESNFDYTNIIDSHFHTVRMYENTGKKDFPIMGIDIGTDANDLPSRIELIKSNKLFFSAAMGPWETENRSAREIDEQFEILCENIDSYKPDFLGEMGLDYHYMYNTPDIQKYLFNKQMDLAGNLKKSVLIHNRESDKDSIEIIKNHPNVMGVIHCFSGDPDLMATALDHDYYISFAGNLTYKSNQNLRDMLCKCPKDRILLETDAPYLAPSVKRGQPNVPEYIVYTYDCAANCLGISYSELAALVNTNFRTFVALSTH